MLCYANPGNKKKKQNQRTMVTKGRAMKHKDHVRKTQLGRVFCIQNLLDASRALESYSPENDYQLQNWNKGLKPLPNHQ